MMNFGSKRNILLVIWLLVVLSFVFKHVNNDFFVFWGYGKQVKLALGHGPNALLEVWDVKGMLFRFYVYVEYLITSTFCGGLFTLQAQVLYKFIGLILLLAILWIAVKHIPLTFLSEGVSRYYYFFILSILLLSVHFICHLQAEMFGVFILILATSLSLCDNYIKKGIAGVLIGLLFFFKSPMILMAGSLFFVYYLLTQKSFTIVIKSFLPIIMASILTISGGLLFYYFFCYQELVDIYDASQYEHTLLESLTLPGIYNSICSFFSYFLLRFMFYPMFSLATICLVIELIWSVVTRSYMTILLYVLILCFPIMSIVISNCFFPYHYYLLAYPSVIIIFYTGKRLMNNVAFRIIMYSVSTLLLLIFFYLLSAAAPNSIKASGKYQEVLIKNSLKVQKVLAKHTSSKILYLDSGFAPSIFPTKSYLRYLYPLPVQRFNEQFSEFVHSKTFNSVKQQMLDFDDKIIICDWEWFFTNEHPEIQEKIEKEYVLTDTFYQTEFITELTDGCCEYKELIFTRRH